LPSRYMDSRTMIKKVSWGEALPTEVIVWDARHFGHVCQCCLGSPNFYRQFAMYLVDQTQL
jgi:hypothetical protein